MSKVPEARARLEKLLAGLDAGHQPTHRWIADEVRGSLELLSREPPVRKAPQASRSILEPGLALAIKVYASDNPRLTMQEIGTHFDVSSGRVSEVLSGRRNENGELVE